MLNMGLPTLTLSVQKQKLKYLVDSGATHSVIQTSKLTPKPKMGGNFVGASGKTVKECVSHQMT